MSSDALAAARRLASGLDPADAARRAGADWQGTADAGELRLRFLGAPVRLSFPGFEPAPGGPRLPDHVTALLVYHLAITDGAEPTGRTVSFADLPDGRFYAQAFRGYTSVAIARRFGPRTADLARAVESVDGTIVDAPADRAWRVPALPRVPLTLLWWEGDAEFEPRAELLYDETAPHHLTTDGCAVLGSWLTAMLSRGDAAPAGK